MRLITESLVFGIAICLIIVPAAAALVAGGMLLIDALRARRREALRVREVIDG